MKFQNIRAFGELTALQNLLAPLPSNHPKAEILERAATVLARVGLAGKENLPVRQLSHGQKQSLSIGLSIAAEPDLLPLDEFTAGLSVDETARTADLIRTLNASGMMVIVIEHDIGFIRSLRARTGVLHYGRLFVQGEFNEIAANEEVRPGSRPMNAFDPQSRFSGVQSGFGRVKIVNDISLEIATGEIIARDRP